VFEEGIVSHVSDLDFMVSHWESNLIAIYQQANDNVMHLDRLGKQMVLRTRRVMRVRNVKCFRSFCWVLPLPGTWVSGARCREYAPTDQ
jgi:hypothetical protein